jgi:hypothetical protein
MRTTACFALLAGVSAFSVAPTLRRHSLQRRSTVVLALPAEVEAATSWDKGTYQDKDVEDNFEALCEVYGSESLATTAAVQVRGAVICPLYASPTLIRESKAALVEVIGADEASVILTQNPSVLTCGNDLLAADPGEIRRLAKVREVLDQIPPSVLLGSVLGFSALIFGRIILIKLGYADPVL